jgi:hypothetical protein
MSVEPPHIFPESVQLQRRAEVFEKARYQAIKFYRVAALLLTCAVVMAVSM